MCNLKVSSSHFKKEEKERWGVTFNNIFYLILNIKTIIISTCNWYKIFIRNFTFFLFLPSLQNPVCISHLQPIIIVRFAPVVKVNIYIEKIKLHLVEKVYTAIVLKFTFKKVKMK